MPTHPMWGNITEDHLIDNFCEIFYNELESWFTADIACCDDCYDDFVGKWPAAYFTDLNFQKSGIDIGCFYSGSSLQNFFTKEQFYELVKHIHCPRCGSSIHYNMWPYSFSFDLPDDFETVLEEIDKLAQATPFLLLSHPFAKEILITITALGADAVPIKITDSYYRARKLIDETTYANNDFGYPPRNIITEGRYNHAGSPVIYLADSESTCFYELRKPVEGIAVAEVKITRPLKILDLLAIEDDWNSILNAAAWSSLMSSPLEGNGWHKPHYTFTRFIADCAIHAGFNAIKYPSVRRGERHNIVLLDGIDGWTCMDVIDIKKMTEVSSNIRK